MMKRWAGRMLQSLVRRLLTEQYGEAFVGDLGEIYREESAAGGRLRASLRIGFHMAASLYSLVKKSVYWSLVMFKNYFLMGFRNLQKHRSYTLISILAGNLLKFRHNRSRPRLSACTDSSEEKKYIEEFGFEFIP